MKIQSGSFVFHFVRPFRKIDPHIFAYCPAFIFQRFHTIGSRPVICFYRVVILPHIVYKFPQCFAFQKHLTFRFDACLVPLDNVSAVLISLPLFLLQNICLSLLCQKRFLFLIFCKKTQVSVVGEKYQIGTPEQFFLPIP